MGISRSIIVILYLPIVHFSFRILSLNLGLKDIDISFILNDNRDIIEINRFGIIEQLVNLAILTKTITAKEITVTLVIWEYFLVSALFEKNIP
jgi:hypothetical protein